MSIATDNWLRRHRISVDEYHRMADVGLLAQDARVELIAGELIDMAPIGSRHASLVNMLNQLLVRAVGDRAIVAVQQPTRLDLHSEPQPDLMLLKPRADFYSSAHPTASDVLLLIEISDTSLRYDREIKVPLYARHGIPEVWIIDINGKQIQRLSEPGSDGYALAASIQGSAVAPAALPAVSIDLCGVFR